jgi:hypothetical protein
MSNTEKMDVVTTDIPAPRAPDVVTSDSVLSLPDSELNQHVDATQTTAGTEKTESDDSDADGKAASNEGDSGEKNAAEAQSEGKKRSSWQKRLDRFNKRISERDTRIAELEAENKRLAESTSARTQESTKPKSSDFDTYDEYLEALTDWKLSQQAKSDERRDASNTKDAPRVTDKQKLSEDENDSLDDVIERGTAKHDDFMEVVRNPEAPITVDIIRATVDSDISDDILYFLGKNPQEARRISALSEIGIAREIGKLEARLQSPPAPPQKRVTQAPPPVSPIDSGNASVDKLVADMSYEEYRAHRMKQERARRGYS